MTKKEKEKGTEKGRKKAIICKPPAARRTWPSRACRIDPSMRENKALNLSLSEERLTIHTHSLYLTVLSDSSLQARKYVHLIPKPAVVCLSVFSFLFSFLFWSSNYSSPLLPSSIDNKPDQRHFPPASQQETLFYVSTTRSIRDSSTDHRRQSGRTKAKSIRIEGSGISIQFPGNHSCVPTPSLYFL